MKMRWINEDFMSAKLREAFGIYFNRPSLTQDQPYQPSSGHTSTLKPMAISKKKKPQFGLERRPNTIRL